MYAIIETGNKQYKVQTGDIINIELLGQNEGEVKFDKVLLVSNETKIEVGTPYVSSAKVLGKVLGSFQGDKVINYKYKSKSNYHRKKGHRQNLLKVEITEVSL
ncbi:50S ribosomal protein L21 [candidate division WOR-1 bacterium RIFOXYD2_FULL_36_8]|uniref:Large ribosomal subunit protein bL21 n=1 Tax=candidate division WOR-1 bacterium RIFOXYB2_FULL_36_35 TaxID=1802578 RepID=A0A1F4S5K0_UNCSA|nr:MAG: 50S ribosomal protein L21 [candidate division WOR-1 bacterium RIFOXYA2_FULL_36_21]OGC15716.1 MAG: 50S ribosomal protein L21 [candidate division WOR-1 bacterium RIFOXYB2_FULL_36_35]OGC21071.1 MAG: 50S ribosomal protein L21 [candidate division WOR-1 bacterium RIFOXYA12_FULL_36_13]OGC41252.1 MAG: 50S ribosomal protein L21 [candidate division WOR-1 bacterium RIFOXYD2_FULL_36_8]